MQLAQDMARLRDQIEALRDARGELMCAMARTAAKMRDTVAEMRTGFRNAHADMASKTRSERTTFVSGLRDSVNEFRQAVAAEIADCHTAWLFGFGAATAPAAGRTARTKERSHSRSSSRR